MVDIDGVTCDLCGVCVGICAQGAVIIKCDELYIDSELCTTCLVCILACPTGALSEEK